MDKDYGFICHTNKYNRRFRLDPYSSPVPRVGFSTGVFFKILQERLRGIMRRSVLSFQKYGVPVQPQRATR